MRTEKTFKIDYKKLDRTYDCTLYREKEEFLKMLTKLARTYTHIKVILVEPKTEIYRVEAF